MRHLLRAGHFVVVPSRSQAKLDLIRERLALDVPLGDGTIERLTTLVARVGEPDGAEALCAQLERAGGVDVAIASIGGWWEGPLWIRPRRGLAAYEICLPASYSMINAPHRGQKYISQSPDMTPFPHRSRDI